jgi:hypothetical protein
MELAAIFILKFLAPRTVRNTFQLLISHLVCVILL